MTEEENVQHCFYVFILHKRTQICLDFLRADRAVLNLIGPATCTDTSTSAKSSLVPKTQSHNCLKRRFPTFTTIRVKRMNPEHLN